MRIAVLGMGHMGRSVAGRLLDTGHQVVVWNRTPGRAGELVGRGATEAATPGEAVTGADAVATSLATDDAVRDVLTGSGAVLAGLGPAAVAVDMSTVAPDTSRALDRAAPGGRFVAAPIVGAPQLVAQGDATWLVAGRRAAVDRMAPLWQDLGRHRWCGEDPGAAAELKLLNNYLLLAGLAMVGEVIASAEAVHLDPQVLREYLTTSPLVAPGLGNRIDNLLADDHEGWFSTELGAKDVGLMRRMATAAGVTPAMAGLVEELYQRAAGTGWGDADVAAIVEVARGRAAPGG